MEIPKELLEFPYRYICNYYESLYPFIGRKVFSIVSLMPCSLILPKIPDGNKKIKQKINLFLIANPGCGKTSLAEEFEKITFNPLFSEYMSPAYLVRELENNDKISLITSDVAQALMNEEFVKHLEQVLGDEGAISRMTMKSKEKRKKVDAIAFMSGTPSLIANDRIKDGLLFRGTTLVVTHSTEEHEKILDSVNEKVGEDTDGNYVEHIMAYYQLLKSIQDFKHPEINPIEGYIISKEIKKEIIEYIKPKVRPAFEEFGVNAVRQLQEAYRFMVNHAFLNVFNREIKNQKLVITQEDLEVAKYLIDLEIETIFHVVDALSELNRRGIKTYKQLRDWQDRQRIREKKISREKQFIMQGAVKK